MEVREQRVAREEAVSIECRLKRESGKLVAGAARLRGCVVEELSLWGEFFADPSLDEILEAVRGLGAREALERLASSLQALGAEPLEDILDCLERLLACGGRHLAPSS